MTRVSPARSKARRICYFHPIRFLNIIEVPPAFLVRFERLERLAGGGACIHATLTRDFDGRAEYIARPGGAGTIIELAWVSAEVRSVLRFMPIALVAAAGSCAAGLAASVGPLGRVHY